MLKLYVHESLEDLERECGRAWVQPKSNDMFIFGKYQRQFVEIYSEVKTLDGIQKGIFCELEGYAEEYVMVNNEDSCKPLKYKGY